MIGSSRRASKREKIEIGWREVVGLPDLGIAAMRAKIDTGARTSALHAVDLEIYDHQGLRFVEFHVASPSEPRGTRCHAHVVDERRIRNTSGVPESRYVVETTLVLGQRHWRIEISLADRGEMGFDLLLGRTAIRGRRLLVNPGRSFLAGPPLELTTPAHATAVSLEEPALEDGLLRTLDRGLALAHDPTTKGDE